MRRGWWSCAGIGAFACFASPLVAADEEAVVSPPVRIDPGSASNRFGLEFSAVAGELEVAAVWMKRPVPEGQSNIILRRADSAGEFNIRIEGLASASNVTGTIRIWNFETAAFDLLGTYTAAELVDGNFHRRGLKPEGTSPGGDWDYVRDLDNVAIVRLEQSMPQIPSGDPLDSEYDLVRIVAVEE